jgi:sortase B
MVSVYDEDFYLTHDLNKNSNSYGVPFLTLSSDLARDTGNNIIYGHNIRINERDVFADLVFYEDIDFYKEHSLIKLVTDEGTDYYIIFAYYLIDTEDNEFVYWDKTAWESESDYLTYMAEVDKRNWLETEIPCSINDKYLTLSSCSVELAHSGTNRMVVMARKLKQEEDYRNYSVGASLKNNPLLPEKLR